MKIFCLLLVGILFLYGCATINYAPYTKEVFPVKSKKYQMVIGSEELLTHRKYKIIGHLNIQGYSSYAYTTSQESIDKSFIAKAKKNGADGIINLQINSQTYNATLYQPGSTTYTPQTTYHNGTTSASAYNNYGGYAHGSGSYRGTSTTYVPTYNPGYTIPYTGVINSIGGDLIVFLDRDTYGYMGVILDLNVKNIDGIMIQDVSSGSAAEKRGIKKGDILTNFGDIKVSSFEDYSKNVILEVGVPVEIKLDRDGKNIDTTLIPQKGTYE